MEAIVFTVVAITLYLVSDRIVVAVEARLGGRLQHRTVVFFVLLLGLALVVFPVLRRLLGG